MTTTKILSSEKAKARNYFRKEKWLLKIFGLSFTGNESVAYKIYSFLLISSTNVLYPLLDIGEMFKHDIDVISDILIYVFATSVGLAKTLVILLNRARLGKILNRLEDEPFAPNMERGGAIEETLIARCIWITTVQTLVYWTSCFLTIYGAVTFTLIKRLRSSDPKDWELTYGPLTVLNITYSPNFEITWFYQNIALSSIVWHFCTVDLLLASILAHISYQFKILQNNIKHIVKNSHRDMMKATTRSIDLLEIENQIPDVEIDSFRIPWKYLHKNLKQAVDYHLAIVTLAREIEDVFNKLLLLAFLGTLGVLCFSIYQSSLTQNPLQILRHVGEALSVCFEVLTICFWGEQVLFESQLVGRAAYEANFVGADLRFQKGLALIIRRSQNPTRLTAGKFTDICLATFTWIMRTSYSAFMVIRSGSQK